MLYGEFYVRFSLQILGLCNTGDRRCLYLQTFVLAAIQLEVSESSSHFFIHFLSRWHLTGSCQFSPQAKQNVCVHLQVTGRASTYCTLIALLQSGEGHHLNNRLHCKWKSNLYTQFKRCPLRNMTNFPVKKKSQPQFQNLVIKPDNENIHSLLVY